MKTSTLTSHFEKLFLILSLTLVVFSPPTLAQDSDDTSDTIPSNSACDSEKFKHLVFDETKGVYEDADGNPVSCKDENIEEIASRGGAKQLGGENSYYQAMKDAICNGDACPIQDIIDGCDGNPKLRQICSAYMNEEIARGREVPEVSWQHKLKKKIGI